MLRGAGLLSQMQTLDAPDHLLVAAPWLRQAAREDHLEGRRSDLRSRLLQGITCRAIMSAHGTKRTCNPALMNVRYWG